MNIDVNGYPPPVLTREMRRVLTLLPASQVERDWAGIRWRYPVSDHKPRVGTLHALCRRGLAQWIKVNDHQGFWRISANGVKFLTKY